MLQSFVSIPNLLCFLEFERDLPVIVTFRLSLKLYLLLHINIFLQLLLAQVDVRLLQFELAPPLTVHLAIKRLL